MDETERNWLYQAIEHFGETNQMLKTQEELAELNIEINNFLINSTKYSEKKPLSTKQLNELRDRILNEIADVEITTAQVKLILNCSDEEFDNIKSKKFEKLYNVMKYKI